MYGHPAGPLGCAGAGLRIEQFTSRQGATRPGSIETLLAIELLPLADTVTPELHDRITVDCRDALRPFTAPDGSVAAPVEVHLVVARTTVRPEHAASGQHAYSHPGSSDRDAPGGGGSGA
ncbi:hypothetical protein AB0K00_01550 [Dactylosporangium sp. NPDC049525]|uniref:hypothetical protein n=1 Tax=Dactylosporangium sp. NPDC049525 TaxID=3154730 RepID=UPI0034385E3B